jgi:AraC-like DNA-binding protein
MLIFESIQLSEIAYRMNYSSVSHLSAQFKKITGYNASKYKLINAYSRMPDSIAV